MATTYHELYDMKCPKVVTTGRDQDRCALPRRMYALSARKRGEAVNGPSECCDISTYHVDAAKRTSRSYPGTGVESVWQK